ncbi:unnamed protein product [Psylliodes chrysocephalus]|uniref:Uncharacterized protein n=1 Tax=Psylliodes chrysocephalus TaxID=3402493 RepID=A0A9P0D9D7_9CUCU|nr:unnamed protein product [Psylliodes chrysocephala]
MFQNYSAMYLGIMIGTFKVPTYYECPARLSADKFSIQRVLVKPAKSLAARKEDNLAIRLPVLPHESKNYNPMPYIFRVPGTSIPIKIANLTARSPPFHILLDHTIAVVWLLFAQNTYDCPLGINQLQWALAFLKTIQDPNGDYTEDVKICIDAIEEILVKDYADLQQEINSANQLDESVHYGGGALGSSTLVTQDIPFSLNYSEILNRHQAAASDVPGFTLSAVECEEELEKLKEAAGVKSIEKLDSKSKEKAINVLRIWKTDQVEKIRGELKRLRSIEDKMKDIDENFQGYCDDGTEDFLAKCDQD